MDPWRLSSWGLRSPNLPPARSYQWTRLHNISAAYPGIWKGNVKDEFQVLDVFLLFLHLKELLQNRHVHNVFDRKFIYLQSLNNVLFVNLLKKKFFISYFDNLNWWNLSFITVLILKLKCFPQFPSHKKLRFKSGDSLKKWEISEKVEFVEHVQGNVHR